MRLTYEFASSSEMEGGIVARIQKFPSSSLGRNSSPSRGAATPARSNSSANTPTANPFSLVAETLRERLVVHLADREDLGVGFEGDVRAAIAHKAGRVAELPITVGAAVATGDTLAVISSAAPSE